MSAPPAGVDGSWVARPEGGARFAMRLVRWFALRAGRRVTRLLILWPTTLYFLLRRGAERRASRAFLTRLHGRPATLGEIARHLHCFASTVLDRAYLLAERFQRFEIRTFGLDALHAAMDLGRGVLLFGSHLGSFEVLRVLSLQRPDVQVRVVLDVGHNPAITELLNALNPAIARTVIDARQDGPSIVLAIRDALQQSALVTLLVDRARPGDATVAVPFIGAPASLPTAPWQIAAALGVPVVLCCGLFRGGNRYDLHFEVLEQALVLERRERRAALERVVARYALRLEHYVRLAPYNWFNFYDFWQPLPARDPAAAVVAGDAAGDGR